jgi:ABC-2 type transport system permease protein
MAVAVLTLITANLMMVIKLGGILPVAVPLLVAQGEGSLKPISYSLPILTGLAGMAATYLWWKYADQSR